MNAENITVIVVVALSTILNMCLILVLVQKAIKFTFMHYFIVNMSLCGLLQGLFGYPLELSTLLQRKNRDQESLQCILGAIIVFGLSVVVIWTIAMLSLERLLTIKFPYWCKRHVKNKKSFLYLSISFTWFTGAFWSLVPLLGWSNYEKEMRPSHRCNINFTSKTASNMTYLCSLMVCCYVMPVAIMFSSFSLVHGSLRRMSLYATRQVGRRGSLSRDAQRSEKQQTLLTFLMIFSFLYAWTPYTVVVFFLIIDKTVPPTIYSIAALNAKTSSFYCPLLYGFVYKPVRRTFKKVVKKVLV